VCGPGAGDVMALAEQAGLSELLANKIHIAAPRVKSGSANRLRNWPRLFDLSQATLNKNFGALCTAAAGTFLLAG
jgi:hypothetical protein